MAVTNTRFGHNSFIANSSEHIAMLTSMWFVLGRVFSRCSDEPKDIWALLYSSYCWLLWACSGLNQCTYSPCYFHRTFFTPLQDCRYRTDLWLQKQQQYSNTTNGWMTVCIQVNLPTYVTQHQCLNEKSGSNSYFSIYCWKFGSGKEKRKLLIYPEIVIGCEPVQSKSCM